MSRSLWIETLESSRYTCLAVSRYEDRDDHELGRLIASEAEHRSCPAPDRARCRHPRCRGGCERRAFRHELLRVFERFLDPDGLRPSSFLHEDYAPPVVAVRVGVLSVLGLLYDRRLLVLVGGAPKFFRTLLETPVLRDLHPHVTLALSDQIQSRLGTQPAWFEDPRTGLVLPSTRITDYRFQIR